MKIWVLSDLHLEGFPFPSAFAPRRPEFDVLVSAGDVWQGNIPAGFQFLRHLAGDRPVIATLGNHEHWRGEPSATIAAARRAAKANEILLLEGDTIDLQGVKFIGTTLWSDYSLAGAIDATMPTGEDILFRDGMKERLFRVQDAQQLYRASRQRLRRLIEQETSLPRVVVTHHAPHPACVAPANLGKWIAGNCASDLSEPTDSGRAAVWLHGHVHHSIDMLRPGGTRILCNPAGALFSNSAFDESLVIEVAN
ncbi:metallophosphoesterase [Bosea sp. AS-1]|uniref:metallophosphoesterase n=1 Tax=Bosea sp. AS-1 TaxID=2015316 RepID=UPI000B786629|nr:metallophosphoesterase [Bosea sp. AS-1]